MSRRLPGTFHKQWDRNTYPKRVMAPCLKSQRQLFGVMTGFMLQVFKRVDITSREEEYQLIGSFDKEPDGSVLTPLFSGQPQGGKKPWWSL